MAISSSSFDYGHLTLCNQTKLILAAVREHIALQHQAKVLGRRTAP
jgi:hypothetical protein